MSWKRVNLTSTKPALRTYVPRYVSGKLKFSCRGTDHKQRMRAAAKAVFESPHFKAKQGADHLVVCAWWGAWRAWEQGSAKKVWPTAYSHSTRVLAQTHRHTDTHREGNSCFLLFFSTVDSNPQNCLPYVYRSGREPVGAPQEQRGAGNVR